MRNKLLALTLAAVLAGGSCAALAEEGDDYAQYTVPYEEYDDSGDGTDDGLEEEAGTESYDEEEYEEEAEYGEAASEGEEDASGEAGANGDGASGGDAAAAGQETPEDLTLRLKGGTPWIDSDFKENVTADTAVGPREDFHLYTNRDYLLEHSIPEGTSGTGVYEDCEQLVKEKLLQLLEEPGAESGGEEVSLSDGSNVADEEVALQADEVEEEIEAELEEDPEAAGSDESSSPADSGESTAEGAAGSGADAAENLHEEELVRTYYRLFMDWDARDNLGVMELQSTFDQIRNADSLAALTALITEDGTAENLTNLICVGAERGFDDPELYVASIEPMRFLMGDPGEYLKGSEYGVMLYEYRKDVFAHIAERLGMARSDAELCFDEAVGFEELLAGSAITSDMKNTALYYKSINNPMDYEALAGFAGSYPIGDMLDSDGFRKDAVYLLKEPEYLKKLGELYTDSNLEGIRSLVLVDYVLGQQDNLDREVYDYACASWNRIFGTSGEPLYEDVAIGFVREELSAPLEKLYAARFGSPEVREQVEALCREVMAAFREILENNTWASKDTLDAALLKLDSMTIHAAYPDSFLDTAALDLEGMTLTEAREAVRRFMREWEASLPGTKPDETMWSAGDGGFLLTPDAAYDPGENSITIPLGLLNEPYLTEEMSTEELYASMCAYWIGRELSHAFDGNGSRFNADGKLADWMTPEDQEQLESRLGSLSEYLDGIIAFGNYHVNGSMTGEEMAASITGLRCALLLAAGEESFDYQAFFTKYASLHARLAEYSEELRLVLQSPYPLSYLATNVPLQQFEEFHSAFEVVPGDAMYLAPESRMLIW